MKGKKAPQYKGEGFRGFNGEVFHSSCLLLNSNIVYDDSKKITKQTAWKEKLVCDICHKDICPPKYSRFLDRIKNAKRKG